jgi:hypothetical protein
MTQDRLGELLQEIQAATSYGILAFSLLGAEESLYIWWGHRLHALSATARVAYGINTEFDEDAEDRTPDPVQLELPLGHNGQYL